MQREGTSRPINDSMFESVVPLSPLSRSLIHAVHGSFVHSLLVGGENEVNVTHKK